MFNEGEQLPTLKQAHDWWQYDSKGKLIIQFLSSLPQVQPTPTGFAADKAQFEDFRKSSGGKFDDLDSDTWTIDQFMDKNHDLLFRFSLPQGLNKSRTSKGFAPTFVESFCLETVFREDYQEAAFNQALTALDYLRDLECTRRTALRNAAVHLGITRENWRDVLSGRQEAISWVQSVQQQELEIETHYANLFVDLRIWVSKIRFHEMK